MIQSQLQNECNKKSVQQKILMVEVKVSEAKYAAAGHNTGVTRSSSLPLKQVHEQPVLFKRRSGSLRRGAEVDLLNMKLEDFNVLVTSLKNSSNTALRLYNRSLGSDGEFEPVRFRPSDPLSCAALEKFFRALARAVGTRGWVQELELGFCQSRQDIKVLSHALSCSASLQHLSLANSALGDERLQLVARGLCECLPLQVLNLSGCALTDASATSITSILKVGVRRTADAEWRLSLRGSRSSGVKGRTSRVTGNQGLAALDLSFNMLSDATSRQLCDVLQLGALLEALNLQGNQLRRRSAQMYLLLFQTWGVPHLVDLRKNLDGKDVGVLEDGRHLHSFSSVHPPFWNAPLLGYSFENIMSEQERNPSSRKPKPGLSCNPPPKPLHVRDHTTSSDLRSGPFLRKNMSSSTAKGGTGKHPDHWALVGWSSPSNPLVLENSSLQERESTAREEFPPEPEGHDQKGGQVTNKPLIPSLCLEDHEDPISPFSCNNEGNHMSTRPILDVSKEYPHLLESENRRNGSDVLLDGNLSPLHPNKQPADKLVGQTKTGEDPSRPLSPILDPATPDLYSGKHPKGDSDNEEKDGSELPNRTSSEFTLSCLRAQTSVDDVNHDSAPTLDVRQGPTLASRSHPGEQKLRKSTQIHLRQSASKDPKRGDEKTGKKTTVPKHSQGKEGQHRQNRIKTVTCQNQKRKQTTPMQHHLVPLTSEWQREESEWNGFMWEMARSLMHLQGLDILMEPSRS